MYDIQKLKDSLTTENIYELLNNFGGNPEFKSFGIVADTICHNPSGEGSHKLYFYENSSLFSCFTNCDRFDVIELVQKVFYQQKQVKLSITAAIDYLISYFNIEQDRPVITLLDNEDNKIFQKYNLRMEKKEVIGQEIKYQPYDTSILDKFIYLPIQPWLKEGISQQVLQDARIGYYPGGEQITIPHYDYKGNFIGLRGRSLITTEAEKYGKYRPLYINGQLYNHAIGGNLYNLNNTKENISKTHMAIVFESEKSTLKYRTAVGSHNDISVASCGSVLTNRQYELLKSFGATEIILCFDKDFTDRTGDDFKRVQKRLIKQAKAFGNEVLVSIVFDKQDLLDYKDSPIDKGIEVFNELYKDRIIL